MKKHKIIITVCLLIIAILFPFFSFAQNTGKTVVNFFSSPTCPHCSQMEDALADIDEAVAAMLAE